MSRKDIGEVFDYTYDDSFDPALTDRVLEHYFPGDELAGKEVLDAGCRVGDFSSALVRKGARRVVGLDLSRGMLRQARAKLGQTGAAVTLVRHAAWPLPFDDGTFDVVTSLESLEFMPHPEAVLGEMVRVLAPGGVLLVTNRVGREARLLPGRAIPRERFRALLSELGLGQVDVKRWQVSYDLAAGRKAGPRPQAGGPAPWVPIRCPACGGVVDMGSGSAAGAVACGRCGRRYPVADGILDLVSRDEKP